MKTTTKLTVNERVNYLLDKDRPIIEIGALAGEGMYQEYGGCLSGGVKAVIGYIKGVQAIVIANDPTVKAGAWFPITCKKILRMQEMAIENNLPVVYLVDSAGIFLPLQDELFADRDYFGRVFYNNAHIKAKGIFQIAAVMGACVAGGAYLPMMCDELLMVEGSSNIFLAGPYLVKSAIGEEVDKETLGGAVTHTEISGIADYRFATEEDCLNHIIKTMARIGIPSQEKRDKGVPVLPKKDALQLNTIIPPDNKTYDVLDIIELIVDASEFDEYKKHYGKTIVCGFAKIDGWQIGIVANQRLVVKNGNGEMQLGGVIYNDSAEKATDFIQNCNQKKIPLLFLQDVTGFMVGKRSEHSGIIKEGAKLVEAVSTATVPKITIITGNSYGAGNYAMCGKAYQPRFIYAWPSAKIAVMGGEQAAKTLLQIQVASLKKKGEVLDTDAEAKLFEAIVANYNHQTKPVYAAARLWVDAIIEPAETRKYIAESLNVINNAAV